MKHKHKFAFIILLFAVMGAVSVGAADKMSKPKSDQLPDSIKFEGDTYHLVKSEALSILLSNAGVSNSDESIFGETFHNDGTYTLVGARAPIRGTYTTKDDRVCVSYKAPASIFHCSAFFKSDLGKYVSVSMPMTDILKPQRISIIIYDQLPDTVQYKGKTYHLVKNEELSNIIWSTLPDPGFPALGELFENGSYTFSGPRATIHGTYLVTNHKICITYYGAINVPRCRALFKDNLGSYVMSAMPIGEPVEAVRISVVNLKRE